MRRGTKKKHKKKFVKQINTSRDELMAIESKSTWIGGKGKRDVISRTFNGSTKSFLPAVSSAVFLRFERRRHGLIVNAGITGIEIRVWNLELEKSEDTKLFGT
jgi:hypothetical protein